MTRRVILASASPRRADLLRAAGGSFRVVAANVDETPTQGVEAPEQIVLELARRKALAVSGDYPEEVVLAADTLVALDASVLGQPADGAEATDMLQSLAGRSHFVHTGMAVACQGKLLADRASSSEVFMASLTPDAISAYVATGLWQGKAGGYGIQDEALPARLLRGRRDTVMGLDCEAALALLSPYI